MARKLFKLIVVVYALMAFSGFLEMDGSFRAARAGVGAMGLCLLGMELYAELVPYRPNRTYYRIVIARA